MHTLLSCAHTQHCRQIVEKTSERVFQDGDDLSPSSVLAYLCCCGRDHGRRSASRPDKCGNDSRQDRHGTARRRALRILSNHSIRSGVVRLQIDVELLFVNTLFDVQPPVGKLRFQPPVAVEAWSGELDATQESTKCPQLTWMNARNFQEGPMQGNEDCLYLNVYTPLKGIDKGLFWLHLHTTNAVQCCDGAR